MSASRRDSTPQTEAIEQRMSSLRAGVLGANDGIVSVAALVVGVAGVSTESGGLLAAGLAGLVGGAISMAVSEYVSVSSQHDSEEALIAGEKRELRDAPEAELTQLTQLYQERGLSEATAHQVATELTAKDPLAAHMEIELHLSQTTRENPWRAALASALAFTLGALLPLLAMLLPPENLRVPVTFVAVLAALALTGTISATLGGSPKGRAVLRLVIGGALALIATWLLGTVLGTSGAV